MIEGLIQGGGGLKGLLGGGIIAALLLSILSVIAKMYTLKIAYNAVWPKLMENNGQNVSNFKPIDLQETFFVSILLTSLKV